MPLLVPWLRFPLDDTVSVAKAQVVPSVLSLVWEGVARNRKNESKFIAEVRKVESTVMDLVVCWYWC